MVLLVSILPLATSYHHHVYERHVLYELAAAVASRATPIDLPAWVPTRDDPLTEPVTHRRHRRGRRGGVRQRLRRRGHKLPLPSLTLANVRSVRNKLDEIQTSCKYLSEFRDSSALCFTETWLTPDVPDNGIDIDGFDLIRQDRSKQATNKSRGGGLCMYVNKRWCQNYQLKQTVCDPNIELICVALRPYYLPREFNKIHIVL